jgi:hypothetical protein
VSSKTLYARLATERRTMVELDIVERVSENFHGPRDASCEVAKNRAAARGSSAAAVVAHDDPTAFILLSDAIVDSGDGLKTVLYAVVRSNANSIG